LNEVGYLGLGSNVGERRENLQAAVELLWAHDVVPLASSSVYETEPVGELLDQRAFFNACLRVQTHLDAEGLLDACKAIEQALGRVATVRHGPRPIDVDVLLYGGRAHAEDRLTVPHPALLQRRFVLIPLLELAPDLEVPGRGRAADALAEGEWVRRAGPPLDVGP
jgi:2-amino-4-hydroxy-6-hydroxymethyldihydropteridine diphosphokinase